MANSAQSARAVPLKIVIDAGNGAGSSEVPLPALSIYGADGELDRLDERLVDIVAFLQEQYRVERIPRYRYVPYSYPD